MHERTAWIGDGDDISEDDGNTTGGYRANCSELAGQRIRQGSRLSVSVLEAACPGGVLPSLGHGAEVEVGVGESWSPSLEAD